jgi:glycosyltransferase involved in cell wall biosynthesis
VTLLSNPELRGRLGRQAREAVLARFRIAHSVGAYRELYDRLLALPRTPTQAEAA